jgi:DNA-binding PadR family transcriptional regulator
MRGSRISAILEDEAERAGISDRFLFWTYPPMIPHGTMYRLLDKLVAKGLLERTNHGGSYFYTRRA